MTPSRVETYAAEPSYKWLSSYGFSNTQYCDVDSFCCHYFYPSSMSVKYSCETSAIFQSVLFAAPNHCSMPILLVSILSINTCLQLSCTDSFRGRLPFNEVFDYHHQRNMVASSVSRSSKYPALQIAVSDNVFYRNRGRASLSIALTCSRNLPILPSSHRKSRRISTVWRFAR